MRTLKEIGGEHLAYLGDAVLETEVRKRLVLTGKRKPTLEALKYVTAPAQSTAYENIEEMLSEEERVIFGRAYNCIHHSSVPKRSTVYEYRRATGFEAVFGYLYLKGDNDRITELFEAAYSMEVKTATSNKQREGTEQ